MSKINVKNNGRFDVSRREAAELLSMSGQTVSNYVDAGLLSARKCGRFLYLCREEIMELIPTAKSTAAAEKVSCGKRNSVRLLRKAGSGCSLRH